MQDRVPTKPNRVRIVPEDGAPAFYATMTRADEPTQTGDPLNKATLLTDDTAALFGLGRDAVPNDVLKWVGNWMKVSWRKLAEFNEAGTYEFVVPDDIDELGVFVLGGGGSGGAISNAAGSAYGGFSGEIVQRVLKKSDGDFTAGQTASVKVGAGGASVSSGAGKTGGSSSFMDIIAAGGSGGKSGSYSVHNSYNGNLQMSDCFASAYDHLPAPYGLSAVFAGGEEFHPTRAGADTFGARNIFDDFDIHTYCGAGGGAVLRHYDEVLTPDEYYSQKVITRAKGRAGIGVASGTTKTGVSATAPGDGGGAIVNNNHTVTSGAGADGLVMVYGRKVVVTDEGVAVNAV